jgi:hypothetical protein
MPGENIHRYQLIVLDPRGQTRTGNRVFSQPISGKDRGNRELSGKIPTAVDRVPDPVQRQ